MRQKTPEKAIIETRQKWNDCEIVQKRKIAADNKENLKRDQKHASDVPCDSRTEREPRHDQLNEVVPNHFKLVEPKRGKMQIPADGVGDRMRFIVVIETGKFALARIAT